MHVYVAQLDVEVYLPRAVQAEVAENKFCFVDASGEAVAVFPAESVVMYSPTRTYRENALSDRAGPNMGRSASG